MTGFISTVVGVLVGIVATVLVGRYYFRRTVHKGLTPFVTLMDDVLRGLSDEVRSRLRVTYQGIELDELMHVQILIGNSGERAIRDVIAPLTLTLPEYSQVLEAEIIHVHPPGREVVLTQVPGAREPRMVFQFPLLNSTEYFILRMLVKGRLRMRDLHFAITADDLPAVLPPTRLSAANLGGALHQPLSVAPLWGGLLLLSLTVPVVIVVYSTWRALTSAGANSMLSALQQNILLSVGLLVIALFALFLAIGGIVALGLGIGEVGKITFARYQPKFQIPDALRSFQIGFADYHVSDWDPVAPPNTALQQPPQTR